MSEPSEKSRAGRFWTALAAVATLLAVFAFDVVPHMRVETNLLALLPSTDENRTQLDAVKRFAERASRELVFLVGSADGEKLHDTGLAFAQSLRASHAFERVDYLIDDRYVVAAEAEQARRSRLLSTRHRELLERGDVATLEREALRAAYTPLGFTRPFPIARDPLGLLSAAFAEEMPGTGDARLEGDILVVRGEGRSWTLVRATTSGDPYKTEVQSRVTDALDAARAAAARVAPDVQVAGSGVILHAAAAASKAQAEVAIFGSVDLLAVVLLIVLVFRRLRPLVVTLLTIGIATVAAITACHYLFGQVHILTLTFGTSLIGVSVDYALHYFVSRMPVAGETAEPHDITPALILGCTTTVAGYFTFLVAPIPGLRQIALFSAVGLATACATVILLYPRAMDALSHVFRRLHLERDSPPRAVPRWIAGLTNFRPVERLPAGARWFAGCVLLAAAVVGIARIEPRDDVRALQRPSADLLAAEQRVRTLSGVSFDTRFVLVTAPTAQGLVERLEALEPVLGKLEAAGALHGHLSPSPGLESLARQSTDAANLERLVYSPGGALERVMTQLGFTPADVAARVADFHAGASGLTPEEWLASPLSEPVRHLWLGELGKNHAAVVLLESKHDAAAVRSAVEALPGAAYVDQVADISDVLGQYRRVASWLMLAALGVMVVCLALFYRSSAALRTAVPAVAGLALTLATLGFLHEPLNLLHVLSLLLVLGLGVDYAIILREGRNQQAVLAVFLSMTTTLISFGLLGFSSVPFVRSIGITVAFGVAFIFLVAMVSKPRAHA